MRASRTSTTRSASLRRSLMARVAAAMWPGNQLTGPPPTAKAISPNPFNFLLVTTLFASPNPIFSSIRVELRAY